MSRVIATFLFIGYMRPAPGTWGSLATLPLIWATHQFGATLFPGNYGGPILVAALIAACFSVGLRATRSMITQTGNHDPSEVVIDEVVGQGIALLPVSLGAAAAGADLLALYPGWIVGFLAFRLFDIWKPWLVGQADRRGDAMGVMLDDVWAGLFAAFVVLLTAAVSHLFLMG